MSAAALNDEHLIALRAGNPLAFGYLESCTANEPDYRPLNRTRTGEVCIGRGPQNDLILPDPHISWSHCTFVYIENELAVTTVKIIAKKTTNGTFINGARLRAGQTRNLVSGDTVAFGVFKAPFPENHQESQGSVGITLESRGLLGERQRFSRSRWQFKIHLFEPVRPSGSSAVGDAVRVAWKDIIRCRDIVLDTRTALSDLRKVDYPSTRCTLDEVECLCPPPTPTFIPPPDDYTTGPARDCDFEGRDRFSYVEDPHALSWYHPDIIWLGEVRHKPDPTPYELPFAFKYWSSVYGMPQGLHPRWSEFSSAVYGDDCLDVGPESLLPPDDSIMPTKFIDLLPGEGLEEFLADQWSTNLVGYLERHDRRNRMYERGRDAKAIAQIVTPGSTSSTQAFMSASEPALDRICSPEAKASKKRKFSTSADSHSTRTQDLNPPSAAPLDQPPRKRAKHRGHTRRGTTLMQAAGSPLPSASVPSPSPDATASGAVPRPLKRSRSDDEKLVQDRPAKRVTRSTTAARVAPTTDTVSRTLKRRRAEDDDGEPALKKPEKRSPHSTDEALAESRDFVVRPRKHTRHAQEGEKAVREPERRMTRASNKTATATQGDSARHTKRQRLVVVSVPPTEDPDARRSKRLKSKRSARER